MNLMIGILDLKFAWRYSYELNTRTDTKGYSYLYDDNFATVSIKKAADIKIMSELLQAVSLRIEQMTKGCTEIRLVFDTYKEDLLKS